MDRKIGLGIAFGVALGIAAPALAQEAVEWRVEDGGNGHWYQRVPSPTSSWDSMHAAAVTQGARLACIGSMAENAFVRTVTGSNSSMLGGLRPGGGCGTSWQWIDGSPFSFTNWDWGQPECVSEEIVVIYASGVWHDFPRNGNGIVSSIFEWSSDCNADGIVDYGQVRNGSLPDYDGDNVPDCCEAGTPCTVGNCPVQWRVDDGGNGHWYEGVRHPVKLRRSDAAMLAAQRSGELVCIGSQFESHWVYDRIASDPGLWLIEGEFALGPWNGARKVGQAWTWDNSEAWQHADWLAAEPNNTGAFVHFYNSTLNPGGSLDIGNAWNDNYDLPVVASYIIEWSADCDADGVVDYGQILRGEVADINANGIPDTCDCPADINQSGTIDAEDLAYVLFAWGMTGVKTGGADINADAIVDANDLSLVLGSWGNCPQ